MIQITKIAGQALMILSLDVIMASFVSAVLSQGDLVKILFEAAAIGMTAFSTWLLIR